MMYLLIPLVLSIVLGGSSFIKQPALLVASAPLLQLRERFPAYSPRTNQPEKTYHRVWQLIQEDYYDKTCNQQNWLYWEHRYDSKMKTAEDLRTAIDSMLASLGDKYTRFLNREDFDDEKSQIDAHLYGIGVQIGLGKTKNIVVIAPMENTPAYHAGLLPEDEIAAINGLTTKGMSVEDAAKHIKGPINTQVVLTILRNKQKLRVPITRAEIPIRAVQTAKIINSGFGYIRLSSFISQAANKEVKEALIKLSGAKGIILDLRDNPGGLLNNAIDISNLFLENGSIVSSVDRD